MEAQAGGDADPYMTALCYFNALREFGGARRIVEDEVRSKLAAMERRRRISPLDQPFANRRRRDVLELTSRDSTDQVAAAKDAYETVCGTGTRGGRGAGNQHDFGWSRYRPPRTYAGARAAEGRSGIYPDYQPRRTTGR